MGHAERKRLSQFSGGPINGRKQQGAALVGYACPRCGANGAAPLDYGIALCEPKGCEWLLKLEPNVLGTGLIADDVAHVGPPRPGRNRLIIESLRKIGEDWERRGVAQEIVRRMKAIRREGEIQIAE